MVEKQNIKNTLVNIDDYIDSVFWKKTNYISPHEYTRIDFKPELSKTFYEFVKYIRKHGVEERFATKTFIYWYHDDYKYWTMGAALKDTILINRAKT